MYRLQRQRLVLNTCPLYTGSGSANVTVFHGQWWLVLTCILYSFALHLLHCPTEFIHLQRRGLCGTLGDWVTPLHPKVITQIVASLEILFCRPWELVVIAVLCGSFAFVRVVRFFCAVRVAPVCPLSSFRHNPTVCLLGLGTCMVCTWCCLLLNERLRHISQGVHLLFYGAVCVSSGGG